MTLWVPLLGLGKRRGVQKEWAIWSNFLDSFQRCKRRYSECVTYMAPVAISPVLWISLPPPLQKFPTEWVDLWQIRAVTNVDRNWTPVIQPAPTWGWDRTPPPSPAPEGWLVISKPLEVMWGLARREERGENDKPVSPAKRSFWKKGHEIQTQAGQGMLKAGKISSAFSCQPCVPVRGALGSSSEEERMKSGQSFIHRNDNKKRQWRKSWCILKKCMVLRCCLPLPSLHCIT